MQAAGAIHLLTISSPAFSSDLPQAEPLSLHQPTQPGSQATIPAPTCEPPPSASPAAEARLCPIKDYRTVSASTPIHPTLMLPRSSGTFSPNPSTGIQTGFAHSTQGSLNASAGASPSTSSPTGNYGLSKIAVAQVSVLLSTLKAKKDDPVEYDNKVDRLKKVCGGFFYYPQPWLALGRTIFEAPTKQLDCLAIHVQPGLFLPFCLKLQPFSLQLSQHPIPSLM